MSILRILACIGVASSTAFAGNGSSVHITASQFQDIKNAVSGKQSLEINGKSIKPESLHGHLDRFELKGKDRDGNLKSVQIRVLK